MLDTIHGSIQSDMPCNPTGRKTREEDLGSGCNDPWPDVYSLIFVRRRGLNSGSQATVYIQRSLKCFCQNYREDS